MADCELQVSAVVHTHSVRSGTHKTAQRLAFSDSIKMMSSLPAEDTLELVKYDFLLKKQDRLLFTEKL